MNPEGLYFTCPVCSADVPRAAKSCPECGACDKSGWSDEARYDGLDLPDLDGDPSFRPTSRRSAKDFFVWLVAVLALIAFLVLSLRGSP